MSGIQRKYSKETKLKAVDMHLNQHIGANTIAKELGLSEKKRVYDWVKNTKLKVKKLSILKVEEENLKLELMVHE